MKTHLHSFEKSLICALSLAALAFANTANSPATYDVKLRAEDRDKQLLPNEIRVSGVTPPYTMHRPQPFIYSVDAVSQKRVRGFEGRPFVIGGVNCDPTIKNAATITGLEPDKLTLRARGGNQNPETEPAWLGANNKSNRSSFDGFLKSGQTLTELLLQDNETVRSSGISHQMVISPVLETMEKIMEMVEQDRDWDPETGFEIVLQGMKFNVKEGTLGLLYFEGLKYDDDMKKVSEANFPKVRSAARKKCKSYRTGWTGAGVQGSFFNDEVYSSCMLTFTREDGKTLSVDCLTPHLIYRYGFYQSSQYRKDPEEIIKFFSIKPTTQSKERWKSCEARN